ncbi:unnamed protein product [Sphagnum balticum]
MDMSSHLSMSDKRPSGKRGSPAAADIISKRRKTSADSTDGEQVYRNESTPKGLCLIINNCTFNDPKRFPERLGSHVDGDSINALFTQLGYTIVSRKNLNGQLFGIDGVSIDEQFIWCTFSAEKCPALVNKPKLFFIQACRVVADDRPLTALAMAPFERQRSEKYIHMLSESSSSQSSATTDGELDTQLGYEKFHIYKHSDGNQ